MLYQCRHACSWNFILSGIRSCLYQSRFIDSTVSNIPSKCLVIVCYSSLLDPPSSALGIKITFHKNFIKDGLVKGGEPLDEYPHPHTTMAATSSFSCARSMMSTELALGGRFFVGLVCLAEEAIKRQARGDQHRNATVYGGRHGGQ